MAMKREDAKKRIADLSEKIGHHNHLYYILAKAEISDFEFDQLLEELIRLEKEFPELASPDSPSQKVGGGITKDFPTVKHRYPMLSLTNSYSREEVADFDARVEKGLGRKAVYVCELKYDGVAVGIRYEKGIFRQAVTRGDGEKGDDISANVRTVRSIPLKLRGKDLPAELEIRGEIFWPLEDFERFNKEKLEAGEEALANPRNATAGTLKLLD